MEEDREYMKLALEEAKKALEKEEVPVGCVLVREGVVIARAHNLKESKKDATAHGEMLLIQQASKNLGDWRLLDTTLYVTLEPCAMCASAICHARIKRLVVGAADPKMGGCGSALSVLNHEKLNHMVEYEQGLMEEEARVLLQDFFKGLRERNKNRKKEKREQGIIGNVSGDK